MAKSDDKHRRLNINRLGIWWYRPHETWSVSRGWRWHWKPILDRFGDDGWLFIWGCFGIERKRWHREDWGEQYAEDLGLVMTAFAEHLKEKDKSEKTEVDAREGLDDA